MEGGQWNSPLVRRSTPEVTPLDILRLESVAPAHRKLHKDLVTYLENNTFRMDYATYLERGYQIGSGAMESLHRTASQKRLKIPGGRWLEETSEAVFKLRMLSLADRWDEFWNQSDMRFKLAKAFTEQMEHRVKKREAA